MKKLIPFLIPAILLVFSIVSGVVIHRSTWFVQDKHFAKLAQSFLKNDLFLNPINLPDGDFADYNGKQYLFFGPTPSVILIPFVAVFGENFPQMFLSFASIIITFAVIFQLCKKLNFKKNDALWLAIFFEFGTVLYFVSLVNISAYIVQATAMVFVVLSLLEYFGNRRWLIIGILVALAGTTRVTLFGLSVFFLLELLQTRKTPMFAKSLTFFIIPLLISIILLGFYNYRRFNSFFDTGYTRNVTVVNKEGGNQTAGFFSLIHVPANLYAEFLMGPEPVKNSQFEFVLKFPYLKANGLGLAIWFTSPLFLFLLKVKKKSYSYSALIGIVILAVPSLVYFGIGVSQFGYRYSLDFIPLLFLILLSSFEKGLPKFAKFLIVIGVLFNCFYMLSIWNSYPLFFWMK